MSYIPGTFSVTPWASPISIAGTDLVTNLDEAVNRIISTDVNSLKNWMNGWANTTLSTYLASEFGKVYAETNNSAVAAANSASSASNSATLAQGYAASINPSTLAKVDTTTGAVYFGRGTIAQRPTLTSTDRVIWYNTDTSSWEAWNGSAWGMVTYKECTLQTAIASAATTSIGTTAAGDTVHITGTTTITSFGTSTSANGLLRIVIFDGALTLTHNATSLILPTDANITTAAGDSAEFVCENTALGYWRCTGYQRKDGTPLAVLNGVTQAASDNSTKLATTAWAKIGFAISLGTNGYIKFPDWMGGVILQWGKTAAVQSSTITFPIAFPTACTGVFVISTASENANTYTSAISLTQFTHGGNTWTATGFAAKNWFAIGY